MLWGSLQQAPSIAALSVQGWREGSIWSNLLCLPGPTTPFQVKHTLCMLGSGTTVDCSGSQKGLVSQGPGVANVGFDWLA